MARGQVILEVSSATVLMWNGDYRFLITNLVAKDFKIRYRNMSLGVLWSVLNPLVMMGVLTFVFTKIFTSPTPHFAVFFLCGLVPYNFFTMAWLSGTGSLIENAGLIKRVPVPREVIPISTVLATCLHLFIQIAILISIALLSGVDLNRNWFWMVPLFMMEIIFVSGLALFFSGVNVYIRDTRYVVESATVVLWWLVPIIYDFSLIPQQYKDIYQFNPIAAIVLAMRTIVLQAQPPALTLLTKLFSVSILTLAIGWLTFHRLERRFYNYL
jgi:ABC-type polysaccharide/polyol phosphate export permease